VKRSKQKEDKKGRGKNRREMKIGQNEWKIRRQSL
jgi:hypothetical protein